jgi:hypothetical protein
MKTLCLGFLLFCSWAAVLALLAVVAGCSGYPQFSDGYTRAAAIRELTLLQSLDTDRRIARRLRELGL